jgi:hypothetical protein
MSTNKKDEEYTINEESDGSAVVEVPEGLIPDDEEIEEKAQGGAVNVPEDGGVDHPDDTQAIREARRAKRRHKKDLAKATSSERDAKLQMYERKNAEMQAKLEKLEKLTLSGEHHRIGKEIEENNLNLQFSKLKMAEAMRNGDGDEYVKAQEMMENAKQTIYRLSVQKAQVQPTPSLSPAVQRNLDSWKDRNPWFESNPNSSETKLARIIDKELMEEGWNPASPDYFEELDRRLPKSNNPRYNDDMDVVPSARRPRSVVRGTGRETVNGSTNRAQYVLSPDQVRAIKDAGMWDDTAKRQKIIQRYINESRNYTN